MLSSNISVLAKPAVAAAGSLLQRPTRARDAACLVLLRRGETELEVLLGRRPPDMAFMPDTYVFPGGAVAAEDSRVWPASPLNPSAIRQMGVGDHASRARALAVAAVRETAEETGLLLGEPGEPGPAAAPVWQLFRRLGLAPALGHLQYIARAITPAFKPLRFHARFFLADAAYLSGDLAGNGELLDLHWVPFSQVERLLITPATVFVLNEVQRWLEARPEERRRKAVFTYHRQYGPRVRYEE